MIQPKPSPPASREALARLEASAVPAARLMRLFANEQRLILLCRLSEGEAHVSDLAAFAGLSQSACSQHLARLRMQGVVVSRRDAQTIYYSIGDSAAARVIDLLCELFGAAKGALSD